MSQSASQLAMGTLVVAKYYLLEVCMQGPRCSSDLNSSCFFCTAAMKVIQQATLTKISLKLWQKLEALFGSSINLSKLWPAYNVFSISDQLEKDWKEFCGNIELEANPLFSKYVTEEENAAYKASIFTAIFKCNFQRQYRNCGTDFEERNAINYIGGYVIRQPNWLGISTVD